MNFKQTIAAAIILFPVVASSVVAKPAAATESQSGRSDRTVVVVESKGDYHKGHFHRHHRRVWIPGHWEYNRHGHRYWVPGRYVYRYF